MQQDEAKCTKCDAWARGSLLLLPKEKERIALRLESRRNVRASTLQKATRTHSASQSHLCVLYSTIPARIYADLRHGQRSQASALIRIERQRQRRRKRACASLRDAAGVKPASSHLSTASHSHFRAVLLPGAESARSTHSTHTFSHFLSLVTLLSSHLVRFAPLKSVLSFDLLLSFSSVSSFAFFCWQHELFFAIKRHDTLQLVSHT